MTKLKVTMVNYNLNLEFWLGKVTNWVVNTVNTVLTIKNPKFSSG
jgi:hypothetical protein